MNRKSWKNLFNREKLVYSDEQITIYLNTLPFWMICIVPIISIGIIFYRLYFFFVAPFDFFKSSQTISIIFLLLLVNMSHISNYLFNKTYIRSKNLALPGNYEATEDIEFILSETKYVFEIKNAKIKDGKITIRSTSGVGIIDLDQFVNLKSDTLNVDIDFIIRKADLPIFGELSIIFEE